MQEGCFRYSVGRSTPQQYSSSTPSSEPDHASQNEGLGGSLEVSSSHPLLASLLPNVVQPRLDVQLLPSGVCVTCGMKHPESQIPGRLVGSWAALEPLSICWEASLLLLRLWRSNRLCERRMPAALRPAVAMPTVACRALLLMGRRTIKGRSGLLFIMGCKLHSFFNPFSSPSYHPGQLGGSDPTFPTGDCSLLPSGTLLCGPKTCLFQPL